MIIYVIKNKVNGKKYVGQTITSLNHRFRRGHLSEARTGRRNSVLYNAIRKYEETRQKLKAAWVRRKAKTAKLVE